jgi:DNA polymerase-1
MCAEARARDPVWGATFVELVFAAYAAGRIRDTQIRETLIAIAQGTMPRDDKGRKGMFTLETIAAKRCGIELIKDDAIRLDFGRLRGVPIDQWEDRYSRYAREDARGALAVYYAQAEAADDYCETGETGDPESGSYHAIVSEPHECAAAFALELMRCRGVRTDAAAVEVLERALLEQFKEINKIVRAAGILRDDGTEDTKALKAIVIEAYAAIGKEAPLTKPNKNTGRGGGNIATGAEVLESSGHPVLIARAKRKGIQKKITTFVPVLKQGRTVPINPGWNGLVSSTRTSCGYPNLQQVPKKGGERECFVARPGHVWCSVDFDTLELRALAYFCESTFGYSAMAEAIRNGIDIHTKLAARMLRTTYEDAAQRRAAKDKETTAMRDLAKKINFGRPGGMGDPRFVEQCREEDPPVYITLEEAAAYKADWFAEFPEMPEFFRYVGRLCPNGQLGTIATPGSGTVRAGVKFTDACNHHFQGPCAVGAKRALFDVTRECYAVPESPLYGSRPVLFIHDEIILEIPYAEGEEGAERLHAAAMRQAEVMIAAMQPLFPTVPITASPALMERWSKSADAAYDDLGRLIPYERAQATKVAA